MKMGSNLGYRAAALIGEQAEKVIVAHELPVSRRLGCGLLGYVVHDFALIKRVGPNWSGRRNALSGLRPLGCPACDTKQPSR